MPLSGSAMRLGYGELGNRQCARRAESPLARKKGSVAERFPISGGRATAAFDGCGWRRPLPIGRGLEDALEPRRDTEKAAVVHLDAIDKSWDVGEAIRATTADTEDDIHERERGHCASRPQPARLPP